MRPAINCSIVVCFEITAAGRVYDQQQGICRAIPVRIHFKMVYATSHICVVCLGLT